MIYDEHLKNANRSKLRRNRPADLLFCARFSASRPLLKSPIFREADRVAQRSTATLAADYVGFSHTARFTSCFSYIYSANRRVRNHVTPFLRKILGLNWLLMAVMLALAIFGVIAIYSATYMREDPVAAEFWRKQANWVVVGFFAFIITSLIDYRWVRWGALPMYLAGLAFLILTKFIGQKVYGARSWLHLGPVNFQPAQLAVIAGIMVLSLFLSQFKQMHPMLRLTLCGAIVG